PRNLPNINQPVVIDGGTQPIYVRNGLSTTLAPCSSVKINRHPCIQLNGNGPFLSVLNLLAGNSTVRWLAIYNYKETGIFVASDNNLIEANDIGTDASGVMGSAEQFIGVEVEFSAANTVIRNNLISGKHYSGVLLSWSGVRNSQRL